MTSTIWLNLYILLLSVYFWETVFWVNVVTCYAFLSRKVLTLKLLHGKILQTIAPVSHFIAIQEMWFHNPGQKSLQKPIVSVNQGRQLVQIDWWLCETADRNAKIVYHNPVALFSYSGIRPLWSINNLQCNWRSPDRSICFFSIKSRNSDISGYTIMARPPSCTKCCIRPLCV